MAGDDLIIKKSILKYYDTKVKEYIDGADAKVLNDAKSHTNTRTGNLDSLQTTAKGDLVAAINEVKGSVTAGGVAAAITIDTNTTTSGALKSYTIKQGDATVGTIDIPKDMVVQSGSVVTNPEGQAAGTYIKLVLANVTEPLFINVGTLIDIYTAKANAAQVQLAINSSTREISATIVAGSVGTTELADNAVTTAKIADGNVSLAKLSSSVQTSLGKADSAVQSITVGGNNGTISVDGSEVAVKGLGSAAYTSSTAYDAAGSASAVQGNLNTEVERLDGAVAQALKDAKEYADGKSNATNGDLTALTNRVKAEEDKSADFETRVAALEAVEYATTADIDEMFA